MQLLQYLVLFTITVCCCEANEMYSLKESFSANSWEVFTSMDKPQKSAFVSDFIHRYTNFINSIGSGRDNQGLDASKLFSENFRKNFNGRWVANDRDSFVADLLSVYRNYGSWQLIPLEVISSEENNRIIMRINIESKSFGNNTAIVIFKYNADNLVEELIEVFSPIQGDNDFKDPTYLPIEA